VSIVNAVIVHMAHKSSLAPKTTKRRRGAKRSRRSQAELRTEQTLLQLARNVKKNSPIVRRKLREAGLKPDPTLVLATAMYFDALDRLAKE
jgi:hypothetical protein